MADSDEEYERRRRDKFRRERPEIRGSDERRGSNWDNDRGGHRDNWNSSSSYKEGGGYKQNYKNYRSNDFANRDRRGYSPSNRHDGPPMKRPRRDWDDSGGNNSFGGNSFGGNDSFTTTGQGSWGSDAQTGNFSATRNTTENDFPTQPAMMLFKNFLSQQDDNITDEEAIKKYNEYKVEFKQTQLNEFFLAHKEEEWFKHKYHPEESLKRKADEAAAVQKRCDVFNKLSDMNKILGCNVDMNNSDNLVKLLDAAVILMEDGTDFDLTVLDKPLVDLTATNEATVTKTEEKESDNNESKTEDKETKENGDTKTEKDADELEGDGAIEDEEEEEEDEEEKAKKEYFKPATPLMDGDNPVPSDGEQVSPTKEPPSKDVSMEEEPDKSVDDKPTEEEDKEKSKSAQESEQKEAKARKRKRQYSNGSFSGSESSFSSSSSSSSDSDSDLDDKSPQKDKSKGMDADREEAVEEEDSGEPQPRALHKTKSIFLRNLAATITKQEIEAMCRRYPGFLRVSLQDPQPERRFLRRGWATFDRTVGINNICWNLNNIRLRDCEMGAIVNRDLTGRVRPVNALTAHKDVVRQDIKHAAKIIYNMDKRFGLWEPKKPEPTETKEEKDGDKKEDAKKAADKTPMITDFQDQQNTFGFNSKNPILDNIIDYLVEEGSYEEEALLGHISGASDSKDNEEDGISIERDENLIQVLDRMVLYLRVVHSYDYYTAVEYPNEDQMPHRCGMMHARASNNTKIAPNDVQDWINMFEKKCQTYVNAKYTVDESELVELGKKDTESEVQRFITTNTKELAKDKWLCPLSGKKFKGPEFVRKHILNKHIEKVDEVKVEVEYFNNYLRDPKRPHLPEHPSRSGRQPGSAGGRTGDFGSNMSSYQSNQSSFQSNYNRGGFGGGGGFRGGFRGRRPYQNNFNSYQRRDNFPRRRGGRDPRGIIEYRDLDAPEGDSDLF